MAGRKAQLSAEQQAEIGTAVLIGRASGLSWKVLVRTYGRSKPTLWRCIRVANESAADKMKHNSPKMKHLSACTNT